MSGPRTVIVVLNWNGKEDTLACLESLKALEPGGHEILIVDNGSEDGSEAAFQEAYPELPLLQTGSNLGFAGGNNAGIAWALDRGADYVLLLNNDTLVEPDFLRHMLERAEDDPRCGIVGASIAYADRPDHLWAFGGGYFDISSGWVRHVQRAVPPEQLRTRGHRHFYITGCTMLLRREMLEAVGDLDRSYFHFCEDVDLCLRAEGAGWGIAVAPEAGLLHKVSATTRVSSPLFLYYNLRSRLSLVRRHGPVGAPSPLALAKLWLRLWRPALMSGLGISGWKALQRAHQDYREGATGPAPEGLISRSRARAVTRGILLWFSLLILGGMQVRSSLAQSSAETIRSESSFLQALWSEETEPSPEGLSDLLFVMAADSSLSRRILQRAGAWGRPMTHEILRQLERSEIRARQQIEGLHTVRDHGPEPGKRPPTWSELRLQGLKILARVAPREEVGRDLRLLRDLERDEISKSPDARPRPSWVSARLQIWVAWWQEVGMDEAFWLDPTQRPDLQPWREQLRLPIDAGGVALFDLLVPLAGDPLASNAFIAELSAESDARLIAEALEIILLYQAHFDAMGVPRRHWDPDEGRLAGHTAAELRAIPLAMLERICDFVPSGANEAEVIESYARWWRRARLEARYYRDPLRSPDLSPWLADWERSEEEGGPAMSHLLRQFYVAEGFRDLLLEQVGPEDQELVAELVTWLARDRDDALAQGFSFAYRTPALRPLPGEEGRLVGIPWEQVQTMIREMLRRITGDVGLPEDGVDEFTRNQFWFDWWRAHDDEPRWYRGKAPVEAAPSFEMERGQGG